MKNLVECFIWVEAQICVASESRLKEAEEEEERQGKSMQTAENKKRREEREREKRRRTRARERTEKKEQLQNENVGVTAAQFIIFFWAARAPGRETLADEWNTTSTTRPDPTRPGQFSAALHNRTVPTFQKTGIVTTVGLKAGGGKSDG